VRVDAPVLVWGDPRVGNMIFSDDLTVAAAIDWEVASIGPAEIDLAHWLFFDEFTTEAAGVKRLDGWPDRETTIARYQELSGRTVRDLEFFEIMDRLFMATTLIRQADIRVGDGLTPPGTRMGHDNIVTQMLARRLGLPVPELSPDYLAHRQRLLPLNRAGVQEAPLDEPHHHVN
jgi:aminoglycoside phosphotransferase (APT) family kinase protein